MTNVFCLGLGEIGGAIAKIEEEAGNKVYYKTRTTGKPPKKGTKIDVMHVSIPYEGDGSEYIKAVRDAYERFKPELIINHGTYPIGTTKRVRDALDCNISHSPVRGMHPDLYPSIKEHFVKYASTQEAVDYLKKIGIKKVELMEERNLEALKIFSTTYYGWNILFAKMISALCKRLDLDYNEVYTRANNSYNEGYTELGLTNVVRPVLYPPEGCIGGHCISQNFKLLPPGVLQDLTEFLNEASEDFLRGVIDYEKASEARDPMIPEESVEIAPEKDTTDNAMVAE